MFSLVEDFLKSGKTQREYSLFAEIGRAKFNYWESKYRSYQKESASGFIRIETTSGKQDQDLEILYPNGVRLKVSITDLRLISQLVRLY